MKYTLLQYTQDILSSMGSDEVNSITDTVEALQVATIVKTVYFDIIYRANLPEHYSIVGLEPSLDNLKPTLMYVPTGVNKILGIKYDARELSTDPVRMRDIELLPLDDFLTLMYNIDQDASNVGSFTQSLNGTTFTFFYYKDRAPTYYTSIDDFTLIFDAYDTVVDTTLQKSKSLAIVRLEPQFSLLDNFIPNLDSEQCNLLINEAKSLAWMELKQSQHPIAERNSRRAWTHLQKNKSKSGDLTDFVQLPNFGRK